LFGSQKRVLKSACLVFGNGVSNSGLRIFNRIVFHQAVFNYYAPHGKAFQTRIFVFRFLSPTARKVLARFSMNSV